MSAGEARRRACLEFGSVEALRESYRAEEGLPLFEDLLQDLRFACRILRKTPTFTAVVVITLMLAIGANVVVFGVLNAVVLHPMEVSNPRGLYQVRHKTWTLGRLLTTSYPAFEAFQRDNTTFSGMVAINAYSRAALGRRGHVAREIHGSEVTGNYFDLLGVTPQLGRFFHEADVHGPNSAPYLVLSDRAWRSEFDGDPGVIGSVVELNRHPFTVVGVASAKFHGTERFRWPDYWIPMANESQVEGWDYLHDRSHQVTVIGRLKPGVTAAQATDNLDSIAARLAREHRTTDTYQPLRLIRPGLFGDDGDLIRGFLLGVTLLGLLVQAAACANLAGLFAARASDRIREFSLRVALGSSQWRLMRQLLAEAFVVSVIGGAAGVGGAAVVLGMLNRWRSTFGHLSVTVDARVILAGLVITLGSAVLIGLVPARQAWRSSPMHMIKGGMPKRERRGRFAMSDLLLGLQIAICALLVTASLVAVRGMKHTLRTPLGFEPKGVMLAGVDLGGAGLRGGAAFAREKAMIEAVRNLPGVTAAGAVNAAPLDGWIRGVPIYRRGADVRVPNEAVLATYAYLISPDYLKAAGTRLEVGRDVAWSDVPESPQVAIVNEAFARKLWGDASAVGRHFLIWGSLTEVVGVVENGKYHDLAESPQPAVYLPISQHVTDNVSLVVRTIRPANDMSMALRRSLGKMVPGVPLSVRSWTEVLADVWLPARAAAVALGAMGLIAVMLAVSGIFGMAAYSVSRRRKELGIRVALGARHGEVISAAVRRPVLLLAVGSAAGLLAGILGGRLLQQIVYQADPSRPEVVIGVALAMALVGLAGAAIPIRRALAVDPAALMRED